MKNFREETGVVWPVGAFIVCAVEATWVVAENMGCRVSNGPRAGRIADDKPARNAAALTWAAGTKP